MPGPPGLGNREYPSLSSAVPPRHEEKTTAQNNLSTTVKRDMRYLFGQEFEVYGLSFVNHPVTEPCKLLAKPRYRDASQQITYTPTGTDTATVVFDDPQRALAAGQIIAFYHGETLLGGGFYR